MIARWSGTRFTVLALWVVCLTPFVLFCVVPICKLFWRAFDGSSTSQPLLTAHSAQLLIRSLALSFFVALFATTLGTVLGFRLGATKWPGKTIARIALLMPLMVPPYLHALGWTTLLRVEGPVSEWLAVWGIPARATDDAIYSFGGAVFVLSLAYFPVAVLFTEKSMAWSSPSLVEAAQVFGAGPWQAFLVARWPFLRPAVASSAMIIFLLASSDLGVPTILKVDVFNFEVFTQLAAFNDTRAATLLCAPLAVIGLIAVKLERRIADGTTQPDTDMERPRPAGRLTIVSNIGLVALAVAIGGALPLAAILSEAIDRNAFTKMSELAAAPAWNTLSYSAFAALALLLLSMALTAVLCHASHRTRNAMDGLLAMGFAIPSTIVALGLLATYDRPGVSRWITPSLLVVAALVVRYAIVALRIVQQSVLQIPLELFDAAATAGAGIKTIFWRIILPLIRVPLLAVTALGFIFASGEIGSTILLHPPGGETLPIALYAIEANSPRSYVAALALIQIALLCGVLLLSAIVLSLARTR